MAERSVKVRQAQLDEQDDLIDHDEHCSSDPQTLAALGVALGQQVRITREAVGSGIYTVTQVRGTDPPGTVRMGLGGRSRLGRGEVFDATASSVVVRSDLSDCEARKAGEFVERLTDDGIQAELIVVAPHGGRIEPHTDDQAAQVASHFLPDRVSTWLCRGYGDHSEAWHITSGELNPISFPLLGQVIGREFRHAVSFHGFTPPDVLVGGAAPKALRKEIAAAIRVATAGTDLVVQVAEPGDPIGGDDAANIVNRLTRDGDHGVQIEQTLRARREHGTAIANAVAEVYLRVLTEAGAAPPK